MSAEIQTSFKQQRNNREVKIRQQSTKNVKIDYPIKFGSTY